MKVLLLSDANSPHTRKWVEGLIAVDVQVALYSLGAPEGDFYSRFSEAQLNVHSAFIGRKSSLLGKLVYLKAIPAIRAIIRNFLPDIVHAHYATSYGLLGAMSGFKPLVVSVWGSDVFEFPAKTMILAKALGQVLSRASVVCSTSEVMAQAAAKYFKGAIRVVPFGVDTKVFAAPERSRPYPLRFAVAKSLSPIYNVEVVVIAFVELKSMYMGMDIELHIAGEGPLRGPIEAAAGNLLNKSIFLHGKIDHSKMPEFYSDKHVLFNLSRFESFGVSVLEASSMGLAVVASHRGGLPEVVREGSTGFLLEDLSINNVANAMLRFAENPELATEMGRNGRIFVQSHFEFKENVNMQIEVYRQTLIEWKSG